MTFEFGYFYNYIYYYKYIIKPLLISHFPENEMSPKCHNRCDTGFHQGGGWMGRFYRKSTVRDAAICVQKPPDPCGNGQVTFVPKVRRPLWEWWRDPVPKVVEGRQFASGLAFAGVNAKLAVDCSALLQTLLRTSPKSRPHYCKPPPPEKRKGLQ